MNQYIDYLQNTIIETNQHYLRRLIRILTYFKRLELTNTKPADILEDHHIVPFYWLKEIGPLGEHSSRKRNQSTEDNFVRLPARVHFLCHVLYVKSFPLERGLKFCLASMSKHAVLNSRLYHFARMQRSMAVKGSKIVNRKSPKLTEQHKQNIRQAMNTSEKAKQSRIKLTNYVMDNLPIVHTPHGEFKGQKAAMAALNLPARTLQYRLKSSNFPDWF